MGLLERLRSQPGWKDPDPKIRRAAVGQIPDVAVVADLARTDPDPGVREEARSALLSLALEGPEETAGLVAIAFLLLYGATAWRFLLHPGERLQLRSIWGAVTARLAGAAP